MTDCSTQITAEPLDMTSASDWLHATEGNCGAVVLFTGQVRHEQGQVSELWLEHYPEMANKALDGLAQAVAERWDLPRLLAWHRVGAMSPGDIIVITGVAARHRQDAFDACQCLMDLVKTGVPLWKKVSGDRGADWVDARQSDLDAASRWGMALPGIALPEADER